MTATTRAQATRCKRMYVEWCDSTGATLAREPSGPRAAEMLAHLGVTLHSIVTAIGGWSAYARGEWTVRGPFGTRVRGTWCERS